MAKGKRKHPEAAIRMNFLHQAANCVLQTSGNKVTMEMAQNQINQMEN